MTIIVYTWVSFTSRYKMVALLISCHGEEKLKSVENIDSKYTHSSTLFSNLRAQVLGERPCVRCLPAMALNTSFV